MILWMAISLSRVGYLDVVELGRVRRRFLYVRVARSEVGRPAGDEGREMGEKGVSRLALADRSLTILTPLSAGLHRSPRQRTSLDSVLTMQCVLTEAVEYYQELSKFSCLYLKEHIILPCRPSRRKKKLERPY